MGEGKDFFGDLAAVFIFEIFAGVGTGSAFIFPFNSGQDFLQESVFLQDNSDS